MMPDSIYMFDFHFFERVNVLPEADCFGEVVIFILEKNGRHIIRELKLEAKSIMLINK